MSEPRREDSIPTGRDQKQTYSVCIASSGSKRNIKCGYDNVHFLFSKDEGKSAPELFNSFRNSKEFDAYIFLSKDYDFVNENSVSDIVDALFNNDKAIDSLYTDILASIKGRTALLKPQPMASKHVLNSGSIMNIPFAVKQRALPEFDEKFKFLFLHIGMMNSFKTGLIVHYPKFCFTINNFAPSGKELNKEMEMLRDGTQ